MGKWGKGANSGLSHATVIPSQMTVFEVELAGQ